MKTTWFLMGVGTILLIATALYIIPLVYSNPDIPPASLQIDHALELLICFSTMAIGGLIASWGSGIRKKT